MARTDSRLHRLLLAVVACVLVAGVFASELPEELTLTNDTSNDYILRSPAILNGLHLGPAIRDSAGLLLGNVASAPKLHFPPTAMETPEPHGESLYILLSVLRT